MQRNNFVLVLKIGLAMSLLVGCGTSADKALGKNDRTLSGSDEVPQSIDNPNAGDPNGAQDPLPDSKGTTCAFFGKAAGPVKVLFIIDDSGSMIESDPKIKRCEAAREKAGRVLDPNHPDHNPGNEVAVTRFQQSQPEVLTQPAFTGNLETVLEKLDDSWHQPIGGTPILAALTEATSTVEQDITAGGATEDTRYIVLLLTDGLPTDVPAPYQEIKNQAATLHNLAGPGDITVHTAYLQEAQDSVEARALLKEIADIGGGEFKSFPDGDSLSYTAYDFASLCSD